MTNKTWDKALALALWAICLLLWYAYNLWFFFAGLVALHTLELFVKAIPLGKKAGINFITIFFMNMVFGITWWRHLERRIQ